MRSSLVRCNGNLLAQQTSYKEVRETIPHQEVMCFGHMLPLVLANDTFKATYHGHMAMLISFYGTMKKIWVPMDAKTKDVEE